jgi:hypothetical protein
MLLIHFIDDTDGQPLCCIPTSDEWLWTVNAGAVTCGACTELLSRGRPRETADAPVPAAAPPHSARSA